MPIRFLRAVIVLVTLCCLVGAAPDSPTLPVASVDAEIKADIDYLQKGLAKTPDKRSVRTLKSVAMMIAMNSQIRIAADEHFAGVRDQALKVVQALNDEDFKEAKQAANALNEPAPAKSKESFKLSTLHKYEISEVMHAFRTAKSGGLNLEADIRTQGKKITDVKAVSLLAVRTATLLQYTQDFAPADTPQDKKKKWDKWASEARSISEEIAVEAAKEKPNKGVLEKKLQSLDAACTTCHNVFKKD